MSPLRSLLFVPASRPDRFAKAMEAGADLVCADLEDAVAPADKEAARTAALGFLSPGRAVRLNGLATPAGIADLAALIAARPAGGTLLVPKVEHEEELRLLDRLLAAAALPLELIALVESAAGLARAGAIAAAPRVVALMLGGADLAAELGTAPAAEALAVPRALLALAARGAGIGAIDMPCLAPRDAATTAAEAQAARRLGFTAKAAIHPAQVAPINAAFTPDPAEIAEAVRGLAAFAAAGGAAAVLDGRLIERPVAARWRAVIARARAAGLAVPDPNPS